MKSALILTILAVAMVLASGAPLIDVRDANAVVPENLGQRFSDAEAVANQMRARNKADHSDIQDRENARLRNYLGGFLPEPDVATPSPSHSGVPVFEACTPGMSDDGQPCPADNLFGPCPGGCKPEPYRSPLPTPVPPPPAPTFAPKLPAPAADQGMCPYLITQNDYSYVCDPATVQAASTEHIACMQPDGTDVLPNAGTLKCPQAGTTISCFIYASYGNVAGSCDNVGATSSFKCADPTAGQFSGDPNTCKKCVAHDCGYNSGPCFDNFIDCFGEVCDPGHGAGPGCAAYFPQEWGRKCIGESSCFMALTGSGQEAAWVDWTGSTVPVTDTGAAGCRNVNGDALFKVLAICS